MSRISCNVTKDLLSSYLDDVCSGESRELVEEHLKECPSCREFLAKLQEQDVGKDEAKVAYLKKVRNFVDIQSLLGILLPLLMLLAGFYGINRSGGFRENFYYIEMPVMMLLCAYALGGGKGKELPSGREWLAPVSGLVTVCAAAVMRYFTTYRVVAWLEEEKAPIPMYKVGPFIHWVCLAIALAAVVLLTALVILAKRKDRVFVVSGNLAWLALNMVLTLDESLFFMSEIDSLRRGLARDSVILAVEFVVVTVLLLLLRRTGLMKRVEI